MISTRELADEQSYEAEISQCVGVTGFHQWFFMTAVAQAFSAKFRAYAVDVDGETLGIVPMLFRHRGPLSVVNHFSFGCFGPLLRGEAFRANRAGELIAAVEPLLRRNRAVRTVWKFAPGLYASADRVALPSLSVSCADSYVIPAARSADDCWKAMSQLRRRSIRQCTARGIVAVDSSPEDVTGWLPNEIVKGFPHQGLGASYTLSEARSLAEQLVDHPGMLWRSVKTAEGDLLAVSGNILSHERVDNWLMVGPQVPKISAHSLAYWDLINWALPKGMMIDFGAAPSEGVRNFKISASCESEIGITAEQVRFRLLYEKGSALHGWGMQHLPVRR